MRRKWKTGWVILPGTRQNPGDHQHRPHPDRLTSTVCDRVVRGRPISTLAAFGVRFCMRCERGVSGARRRENTTARREREAREKDNRRKGARIADTDAYDRSKLGGSLRTVSAGLPGLGRRH